MFSIGLFTSYISSLSVSSLAAKRLLVLQVFLLLLLLTGFYSKDYLSYKIVIQSVYICYLFTIELLALFLVLSAGAVIHALGAALTGFIGTLSITRGIPSAISLGTPSAMS